MISENMSRKTVLFVDDDEPFLEVLQAYMERLSADRWHVLAATDSKSALNALDASRVDLAVLDVRMPIVDGVQLLHLINRKRPQLRKAVLSGFLDDECRSLAFNGGAELVLEKPHDQAGYEALFAALNELVELPVETGFRGVLRRAGIEDIIQMECLSRRSLILELAANSGRGRIYIRSGSLIHAECGEAVGDVALQRLLTLSGGEFRHLPFAEPARETLEGSWEFLLLEAVRQRDEALGGAADRLTEPTAANNRTEPAGDSVESVDADGGTPLIHELAVFSDSGEVLYQAGATDAAARGALCAEAIASASRIESLLPIGTLERVEFLSAPDRVIARFLDGQSLFLRAADPP
jgi:CheY-like chemotaxis protein